MIFYSNIIAHIDEHKLLSDKQHAFGKWLSFESLLTTVINDWAKILDNQSQVDALSYIVGDSRAPVPTKKAVWSLPGKTFFLLLFYA